jgi:hypothetical protein
MNPDLSEEYSDYLDSGEYMTYMEWLEVRLVFWRRRAWISFFVGMSAALAGLVAVVV